MNYRRKFTVAVTIMSYDSLDKLASWAGWVSKASKIALERET